MDSHYFLSKSELLGWINDTLGLRLSKVEDTCNGAVACQLMDALHPGVVPLKKVDFNARGEYDMINNYKVLQEVFTKLKVDKYIEVNKLIKGRPLDNIEFMQWFKSYWDGQTSGQAITGYDGPSRRAQSKTGDLKAQGGPAPAAKLAGAPAAASRAMGASAAPRVAAAAARPAGNSGGGAELAELRNKADTLEKEKEFYYTKLRDIELLCQTPVITDIPIMKKVEAILYAATAEEGRQILIDTQKELAGTVYLEEDQIAAAEAAAAAEGAQ